MSVKVTRAAEKRDEAEFCKLAYDRWRTLPATKVLDEAAKLFHIAVFVAKTTVMPDEE